MKYKVGELVRIKKTLMIGIVYYNEGDDFDREGEKFTSRMKDKLGKEGRIIKVLSYGYKIDIDPLHTYTDGMLEYPYDELALKDYEHNPEVEKFLDYMLELHYKKLIDEALDKKMHLTDPEGFKKIMNLLNNRPL